MMDLFKIQDQNLNFQFQMLVFQNIWPYLRSTRLQISSDFHLFNEWALIIPALFGFSATQAIVIPPISESLKRRRKVPLGLDISMSWACCLFTKPNMALKKQQSDRVVKKQI